VVGLGPVPLSTVEIRSPSVQAIMFVRGTVKEAEYVLLSVMESLHGRQ